MGDIPVIAMLVYQRVIASNLPRKKCLGKIPQLHLEVFEILLPPTRMPRLGDLKVGKSRKKWWGKVDEEREKALFYILESLGECVFSSFLGRVVSFLEGSYDFSLPKIL